MTGPQIPITLYEWDKATPTSHPQLLGATIEDTPEDQALLQSLSQDGKLEVIRLNRGLSLGTGSYVGQIDIGNVEVTILPKLKSESLLKLLRYAYGLRNLHLFAETFHKLALNTFHDLLISQLIAEVQELASRGLYRTYVRREEELSLPRGRIAIQRLATTQGSSLEARLPCIHHPRTEDCFLNRIVLAGVELASSLATDLTLRREIRRLGAFLETSVARIRIDGTLLERAANSITRLTTAYRPTITILRLLADSMGVSITGTEGNHPTKGFLFDMNRFFQAILSRFLRENLPDCTVRDEYRLHGVIRYDPEYNPKKCHNPTPRPDFVIVRDEAIAGILDAKYRDLWENPLPPDMLYQLGIYAAVHELKAATILYPSLDPNAKDARLNLYDSLRGQAIAHVWLRPVLLDVLEDLVMSVDSAVARRKRQAYAKQLAFGEKFGLLNVG